MKIIYQLNKGFFILTLVLYLTLFFGLYAQMALGAIQLLTALFLFFRWNLLTPQTKKQLKIYWVLTILYSACWLFNWDFYNELVIFIAGIIIIPLSIASYFLYILNRLKDRNL